MCVKVSSAVAMVLPAGVFITTTPWLVAASTSTLSTPTPARPTTFRSGAALKNVRRDLRFRADGDSVDVLYQLQNLRRRGPIRLDHFNAGLLAQVGDSLG
jgi:hypothetical protein